MNTPEEPEPSVDPVWLDRLAELDAELRRQGSDRGQTVQSPTVPADGSDAWSASVAVLEILHRINPLRQELPREAVRGEELAADDALPESSLRPEAIGRFRIERVLGEGGASIVYLARDPTLGRAVAVKVLRAGDTESAARFDIEVAVLAELRHAHIVQIYDRGDHQGLPFLVMEYLGGGSLDRRAERVMPGREAARLLVPVARALAAAHAAGVVHRDVKPANVLLTEEGVPKLSDFGMVRRLEQSHSLTRTGTAVGTPAYMAPEQVTGRDALVGPRTDVYGLGAVLYELLTGRPPFQGVLPIDIMWQIAHYAPIPVRRLNPEIDDELATICHKCLERDPDHRYTSATELADDLERYLGGLPIRARPVSMGSRFARWCWRNPVPTGLTSALLVSLVAGLIAAVGLARWALGERDQALVSARLAELAAQAESRARLDEAAQRDQADAVANVLELLFWKLNPRSPDPTRELARQLDEAVIHLERQDRIPPLVRARLQLALGNTRAVLGDAARAVPLLEESRATRERLLGVDHRDTLTATAMLAAAVRSMGQYQRALDLTVRVHDRCLALFGPDDEQTLESVNSLGALYVQMGKTHQALPLLQTALDQRRGVFGAEDDGTFAALYALAYAQREVGDLSAARTLLEDAVPRGRTALGADHLLTIALLDLLGQVYMQGKETDRAEPLLEESLRRTRGVLGTNHPEAMLRLNALAGLHLNRKQYDRAIELLEELLPRQSARLGDEHPDTLVTRGNLANLYALAKRRDEAIVLFEKVGPQTRKVRGESHQISLDLTREWIYCLVELRRYPRAVEIARQLVAAERKTDPVTGRDLALDLYLLGDNLVTIQRIPEAERVLREGLDLCLLHCAEERVRFETQVQFGLTQLLLGKVVAAEKHLIAGYEGLKVRADEMRPTERSARLALPCLGLVKIYEAQGKKDELAKWRSELELYPKLEPPK